MKSNICLKVFKSVFFLSVVTLVILVDVLVVGTLSIHYNLNEKITDYSTSYAQNFNVVQDIGKTSLEKFAKNKAKYID